MSLHWLPIDLRIEFKILIITYKTLHSLAPAYIEDLLDSYIPGRYLRSAEKNLLAVPGFKLNSYGRRAFSVPALCFGTVFHNMLGMQNRWTYLKECWKQFL